MAEILAINASREPCDRPSPPAANAAGTVSRAMIASRIRAR
jgi:hypothetical protein